ncbi:prenyltransferase/squalene oxidase repeat-containing protein [Micromonospora olivasterospora]|uniref:Squalene-hopene cyclase-like protein n=1 Tax=Micromonospora olivasterospora TaxID=1880 RepID=A0A562I3F4_MICOL|nr:prenyltransferase/squalene oxidase repeat-containing protein [Micromonospora olivasterospora]TWH65238.1 squalene-hopene cyclase-like protein [Micromonospora olivasterospora]
MRSIPPWTDSVKQAAEDLLAELAADAMGQVSPSVYETARLVATATWLDGHPERVCFLLDQQGSDGSWGAPDGYGLVPALSAVEALLTELRRAQRPAADAVQYGLLVGAVTRGLAWLSGWLGEGSRNPFPDTIAAELIVPWLIGDINRQLGRLVSEPLPGLEAWSAHPPLPVPAEADEGVLEGIRSSVRAGHVLPDKLWHSLEVLGVDAAGAYNVRPVNGAVGGSPAATVAWQRTQGVPARTVDDVLSSTHYLEEVQRRGPGPVPGISPITSFERAWTISALATGRMDTPIPRELVDSLRQGLSDTGAPAAPGLPPDSDDTAGVLYALAKAGDQPSLDCLWGYEADSYFRCFMGERTPSTSTNAHILETLAVLNTADRTRRQNAAEKIAAWLRKNQEPDGKWWDKWHASPYYATACCALALDRSATLGINAVDEVDGAVRWVLDTQRADGSWGRWEGTDEETSYALHVLLATHTSGDKTALARAAARGCAFLLRQSGPGIDDRDAHLPPLWHDKDLYAPVAVIRAARLAALHLAATDPDVMAALPEDVPAPAWAAGT